MEGVSTGWRWVAGKPLRGLSNAELPRISVHVVSKFGGLFFRFAHRHRDAPVKMDAGLVQPLTCGTFAALDAFGFCVDRKQEIRAGIP